jgi:hypothetical protein
VTCIRVRLHGIAVVVLPAQRAVPLSGMCLSPALNSCSGPYACGVLIPVDVRTC